MLKIRGLESCYGESCIVSGLTLDVPKGEIVGLIGRNGVGKSTLFRCILGLSPHYSGTILVNGKDLRALSVRERAREISYIPQSHAPVYDYEVVDVVLMATGNDLKMLATPGEAQLQRAHEALARIGIEHLAHRTYTQISGGEQQLVLIARALAQNAQTIIMDEPTSALDLRHQLVVMEAARRYAAETGAVCLAVVHDLLTASRFSRSLLLLEEGRISALASPEEVLRAEKLEPVYHVDVSVEQSRSGFLQVVPLRPHSIAHEHGGHHGDH